MLWSLAGLVPVGTPLRIWLFLPGTFAPAIVALWIDRSSLDGVFKWQVNARWYAFAFLYIGVVKLGAALTQRLVADAWPAIESGPWLLLIAGTLVSTPVQAGEEVGWRGFALPRLAKRLGLRGAALLLGIIWAAWHLPLFFIAGTDTTGAHRQFTRACRARYGPGQVSVRICTPA